MDGKYSLPVWLVWVWAVLTVVLVGMAFWGWFGA